MTTGPIVMLPVTFWSDGGDESEPQWGYIPAEIIEVKGERYTVKELLSEKIWVFASSAIGD